MALLLEFNDFTNIFVISVIALGLLKLTHFVEYKSLSCIIKVSSALQIIIDYRSVKIDWYVHY